VAALHEYWSAKATAAKARAKRFAKREESLEVFNKKEMDLVDYV